jgi:pyridoxamine 5'-phosphate oxidase
MADFSKRTSRLSLADLRASYQFGELREEFCDSNPIVQFEDWFKQAQMADIKEPNAMMLATVGSDGKPSARVVLLKEVSELGFVFYTNYNSRKGQDLKTNPFCGLTFYWAELERQVRIEGQAARVPRDESARYFRSRPKGSRLGAIASYQSAILANREELERRLGELEIRYRDTDDVPTPEEWGGYRVVPHSIEFWQGRPNRLHDRLRYRKTESGEWALERLSP